MLYSGELIVDQRVQAAPAAETPAAEPAAEAPKTEEAPAATEEAKPVCCLLRSPFFCPLTSVQGRGRSRRG